MHKPHCLFGLIGSLLGVSSGDLVVGSSLSGLSLVIKSLLGSLVGLLLVDELHHDSLVLEHVT